MIRAASAAGAPAGERPANGADRAGTLRVFISLWGIAALFHIASFDHWGGTLYAVLLVAAAFAAVFRPSVPTLALLATAQLFEAAARSPWISNHWLLTALVNLTVLLAIARRIQVRRRLEVDASDLYRTLAPALRLELLVLYFWVVFHKLNTAYLDPAESCGAAFWRSQTERFGWLPAGPGWELAALWGTLGAEALIPLLLVRRRTTVVAIALGLAFHGAIGFNPQSGFYNFSSMIVALYVLFLPAASWRWWHERLERAAGRFWAQPFGRRIAALTATAAAAVLTLLAAHRFTRGGDPFLVVWFLYLALTVPLLLAPALSGRVPYRQTTRRLIPADGWLWIGPLLVLLNGTSPYLGLKTETSFAMFSNLRTEGGASNHLLMPAAQPFSFQRRLVEVIESDDFHLGRAAREGTLITRFDLRRRGFFNPDARVVYRERGLRRAGLRRDGGRQTVGRLGDDPGLTPPSRLAQRLLSFRTVRGDGTNPCMH